MSKRKGPKHHRTYRGNKIRLVLRDGSEIEGRFKESTRRWVRLMDGRQVEMRKLDRFLVLRWDRGR